MRTAGLGLIVPGVLCVVAGTLIWLAGKYGIPLGRLPGDLKWEGRGWSLAVPLATSIIISIILTVMLNLFLRR